MDMRSQIKEGDEVAYAGNWSFEGTVTNITPNPRRRPDIAVTNDAGETKTFDMCDLVVQ